MMGTELGPVTVDRASAAVIVQIHYPNHHTGMCTWCTEEVFPCPLYRAALTLLRTGTTALTVPGDPGDSGDPVRAPRQGRRR